MVELLSEFSRGTGIYAFMNSPWGWPTAESIHFLGIHLIDLGALPFFFMGFLACHSRFGRYSSILPFYANPSF